jgi:hypothetical protein
MPRKKIRFLRESAALSAISFEVTIPQGSGRLVAVILIREIDIPGRLHPALRIARLIVIDHDGAPGAALGKPGVHPILLPVGAVETGVAVDDARMRGFGLHIERMAGLAL